MIWQLASGFLEYAEILEDGKSCIWTDVSRETLENVFRDKNIIKTGFVCGDS